MNHSHLSQHTSGRTHPAGRRARLLTGLTALLALAAFAASTAPRAAAISDAEELSRFGTPGSGAGQLFGPRGVATDLVTGHVFAADQSNNRVSEFTPWGNFVKAFGWDVAPGAVNEQQEVRVRAASGQFKLTFGASTTTDLAFDAPGSAVQAALNALPSIGGAGGEVSVQAVPGTPDGKTPAIYVVAFKGSLAATNVAELTIADGATALGGGVPSTVFEARTRVDGHTATAGLESCTAESGCKAGLSGPGAGQLAGAAGMAVDAAGNIYVRETTNGGNGRVQKFDSAGRFLLMFGGEVNQTTSENRCTKAQLEGGDVCGVGVPGAGNGQFGASYSSGIALGAGGKLFAGDIERIQRFNLEGEWELSIPTAKTVHTLAIAPGGGDFYAVVGTPGGSEENVRILDATSGAEKGKLEATELKDSKGQGVPATKATEAPIATDPAGNLFVKRANLSLAEGDEPASPFLQFDPTGEQTSEFGRTLPSSGPNDGLGTNAIGDLYVASNAAGTITAFGPAPVSFEAPPPVPPEIDAQFAASVDRTSAVLGAEINPHFWTNTRFYVQYGTGKCSEGGCEAEKPVPPGAILATQVTDGSVKSAGIAIEGLKPGTTYHYRFVAESSGGGPVRGVGGEVGIDGEESSFTTYPAPAPPKTDCPNQGFRTGPSAPLPDCRAYEMVSPVDKNNGDIKALLDVSGFTTALSQSALDGEKLTYSSYRGFGDPAAAPYTNQYLATREQGVGWSSESLAPAQVSSLGANAFENHYKAFSADLCQSWLVVAAEPVLDPDATPDYKQLYRREGCGGGGYEALIGVEPNAGKGSFFPFLQGTSTDGKAAIFMVKDKLTEEGPSGIWQAYHASEGGLHLVCVLPSGAPSGGNCAGGTSSMGGAIDGLPQLERLSSLTNALSADGNRVYWTDSAGSEQGPGKVYLRINPGQEQSEVSGGECAEPEKACTVKVSETKTAQPSRFLGASTDGSKALFEVTAGTLKDDLYLFDAETGASTLLAGESQGVAGASADLSRIYFASAEALPETSGATAGKPNLYLDQEGTKTFVATLSATDVAQGSAPSNTNSWLIYHAARATPDGSRLAFISSESLSGYDNTDPVTGKAAFEIYLYEAGTAGPVCVSCNPSGARPMTFIRNRSLGVPTAAWLTLAENSLYSPRVLSPDGKRLFFNSYDALLPRDTNGKGDVYQWQAASGQKACDEKGAELYVPSSGGCLSLISSGQSPQDSELLDTSANGNDAFFTTSASLLPQDPGLIDIYDARANGGLPAPPPPPGPCQGEACQFAPPPPNDPTPGSASFKGAGNPSAGKPRPRCGKGKARRKGRCVSKRKRAKQGAQRKRANANRRAGR